MDAKHCGSKGWTRMAHVDMSNKLQPCPGNSSQAPYVPVEG